MKSKLTEEELALFSDLFSATESDPAINDPNSAHRIVSVTADVPKMLTSILGKSKLTLLAEISHYRLWFPLMLNRDDLGQIVPTLGIPEVVDISGNERSWRLTNVSDVKVIDSETEESIDVLSLSASGLTFKSLENAADESPKSAHLILPDGEKVALEYQPVRNENGVMAAKITALSEDRELLRRFLFTQHKTKYADLYNQNITKIA
ncbi:hypothetical protein [Shewanella gelidii]|uniref:PilZ domain-containing protein n=1 Tax=Shewanella gelidii TaxID=1642821 RepID=A0A917JTV3_9GAMM|nr:hypothetical protein [Shewanella gelidii]MCL1098045.1 hypothetical protein [Shewanella gelidii]GGI85728.1 hypothetical protein GCM10009332_23770 [Shewanella gelidii]